MKILLVIVLFVTIACYEYIISKQDLAIADLITHIKVVEQMAAGLCECPDIAEDMYITDWKKSMKYKTMRR